MKTTMKFHIASVIVAAAALFSSSAQAQWMRNSDQLGFYAAAGVGSAETKDLCSDAASSGMVVTSCDEKDMSWKLSAGYQFHRNVAVEVGYVHLGKYSVGGTLAGILTSAEVKIKAFEFLAVGILPLTREFSAYVKAGGYSWDANASATGALVGVGDSGTDFTFGFGVKYDFTRNLSARVEWQRYVDLDITTIGAGAVWNFR